MFACNPMMAWMGLSGLIGTAALAVFGVWLLTRLVRPTVAAESPLHILKRRYALGEIDREQFEAMKRNLAAVEEDSKG